MGVGVRYTTPGQHKDVAAFRAHFSGLDPAFGCDEALEGAAGPLGRPYALGARALANRWAIHPMEGWDATRDGAPSEHTLRRWRRFGRSGAALVWGGEAFAVQADGRANPRQLYLNPDGDVPGALAALLAALRAGWRESGLDPDAALVGLQLTHSGRFARPDGDPAPRIAVHAPTLDARFDVDPDVAPLTDGELEGIGERYVEAARLARDAGFQFVDVKACHGYLVHELLGARARPGPYGGDFAGRTRFFRRVVHGIRGACPELEVGVRMTMGDVVPFERDPRDGGGRPSAWREPADAHQGFGLDARDPTHFDVREPLAFLDLVRELGIRLVNVSLGSPYSCPHLQRPAAYPPSDGYLPPEDPLLGVLAHLALTRACKARQPELLVVGSGYSYLMEWLPHVAQHELRHGHVDFVGLGRMVLAYPELPADVLAGRPLARKRICRTFSDCTTGPRQGLISGCYPLDPHYRERPEAEHVAALRRAAGRGR
jgi:2,4-dienoyl-CoA reductase-like NADH-dependent reductase (Old Yellow Enzyme family)